MMRTFVLLVVMAIARATVALSQAEPNAADLNLEKLFIFSVLVVEGVVEKITTVEVAHDDFIPGAAGPNIPVAIILFKVNRVLLGYPQADCIEIYSIISKTDHNYFDMTEADRCILSLHYGGGNRESFFSGKYISRMTHERFFIEGSRWFQGRKDRPIAEGDLQALYSAIKQAATERSFEVLTRRADLVVRGEVAATAWADDSGEESGIQKVTMTIHSIIKGAVKGDSLVLSLQTKYGVRRPSWGVLVPSMHVGEEWIAFLKFADDPGYYPLAGVNGLFMVKGDSVIRDNWNEMLTGYSLLQMELDLRRIAAQGE